MNCLASPIHTVRLGATNTSVISQGYGRHQINESISRQPLTVAGQTFPHGLGSHPPGGAQFDLDGLVQSLTEKIGVDDGNARGSIEFLLFADRPRPFQSWRAGIHALTLIVSDALDGNAGDHADWIETSFLVLGALPRPISVMNQITIDPSRRYQTIANFGASDSWTVEPLWRWPEAKRNHIADLLFDSQKGIGLSGWRHNLGGGLNHTTISIPLRTVDSYATSQGHYNWSACPGAQWMLRAARQRGVKQFTAYAVTPPNWLTRNGKTNGTDGLGSTNLKRGAEETYARYLADVVQHFNEEDIPIVAVSPLNEPDFEWNGKPSIGTQEGCRASNADIRSIVAATRKVFDQRKMEIAILAPEANSPQVGFQQSVEMANKYKSNYGDYANSFLRHSEWVQKVNPTYAYHSYWSDGIESIVPIRNQLREILSKMPAMPVWQTEFCQMAGPNGEGGNGRDLGMTLALNVARIIHFDLTIVGVSSWSWWLAVSDADYKDGLIYVDDLDRKSGTIYPSKTLFAFGQYSRFIRPGFKRVAIDEATTDINGLLASAFIDPQTNVVVVVIINMSTSSKEIQINLPGYRRGIPYLTSDRKGHDIKQQKSISLEEPTIALSRSVITYVCTE